MPAPTGLTLQIDGAATVTGDLLVDLTINATGAVDMRFSNNGFDWTAWEPFATSKLAWDLRGYGGNDNAGVKTVWVDARSASAEVSNANASITYRRAKPTLTIYPAPQQRAGTTIVDIPLVLRDPYFNEVNVVQAEYTLDGSFTDGGSITFLPNDPAHDGVTLLSTAPNGVSHNLVWDAGIDVEPDVSDIAQVRVRIGYANETSELALSQQFKVDTRDPIEVADLRFTRGDAAEIRLALLDRNGAPIDATGDVQITSVKNSSGVEQLGGPILATRTSLGHYSALYNVANGAELGLWLSVWEYEVDHIQREDTIYFSIIEEAEFYTPLGTETCVVYGQLLNATQRPLVEAEVHFLPHHLSDSEFGNPTVISTNPVIAETDEDGKFHVELVKNTELIIYIPALSFRQFAKVPVADTAEYRSMMTALPVPPRDQFGNRT